MTPDQTGTATLTEDQVLQRIRATLAEQKVPGAETASTEATWSELDVDSLDLVELVKTLEDEFGVTIHDEELKPIASVGDAVTLVLRLDAERAKRVTPEVVITGRGVVAPAGEGADAFFDALNRAYAPASQTASGPASSSTRSAG